MKALFHIAHALLVLVLTALLIRVVYYGFAILWADQHPQPVQSQQDSANAKLERPSPQEMAESMNTYWDMWDEDHCKHVCETSWTACLLRQCDQVPGVRRPNP
ncbi:hypothetical protein P153DRAFT_371695 [Dothidotthia symphoricarpi CBS 119687]|uniref:Uncharacterized protein n=1 Tax=Dothidotthia symphoricarpi CBS 119687 TaxID=1392245 RepID=A0A6A5ZUP5_9PLEO|nr:uncharacterized protein P153DRAFT_371695 [Dothidotthia symphoricarpi CBS 119687]KAF2123370.1 hypothetical protein P153DRAFT_371695 [Dothidotthia symphoricarpi CBS 119687]